MKSQIKFKTIEMNHIKQRENKKEDVIYITYIKYSYNSNGKEEQKL